MTADDDEVNEDYESIIKLMKEAEASRRMKEQHKWDRMASLLREALIIAEYQAK